MNIPRGKSIETAKMDQLVDMLVKRIIDTLMFAPVSVITFYKKIRSQAFIINR